MSESRSKIKQFPKLLQDRYLKLPQKWWFNPTCSGYRDLDCSSETGESVIEQIKVFAKSNKVKLNDVKIAKKYDGDDWYLDMSFSVAMNSQEFEKAVKEIENRIKQEKSDLEERKVRYEEDEREEYARLKKKFGGGK